MSHFEILYGAAGIVFILYFFAVNLLYGLLTLIGAYNTYKEYSELGKDELAKSLKSNSFPEISFIVPAYNEVSNIVECIERLLHLSYRKKEIIIVNDGSEDDTLGLLKKKFKLELCPIYFELTLPSKEIRGIYKSKKYPEIVVMDKENGERYDAVNAGINACTNRFFITVDADTIIDDVMFELIAHSIFRHPETIALGAGVRINNGCEVGYHKISTRDFPKTYLAAMQSLEYLRSFLMRQGWSYVGGNFCIAGAFGIFLKEAVMRVKGFAPTYANDLEITIRLQRLYREKNIPYRIHYLSEPVAWTRSPDSYKYLSLQRFLWQRGTLESMWFHRKMFFNLKHGAFGWFVLPLAFFGEVLEPAMELGAYFFIVIGYFSGLLSLYSIIIILLVAWGCSLVWSLFALLVEECSFKKYRSFSSIFKLCIFAFLEFFGYRQMTIYWRIKGFFGFFARFRQIQKDSETINKEFEKGGRE